MLSKNQKRSWATSLAWVATLMVLSSDDIERHVSLRTTQIVIGNRSQGGSTLPAAPKRLVELNDAQQLVQLDLPEVQLGLKQIPVGIKGVELGVDTSLVPHIGQLFPLLKHRDERLLLFSGFPQSLVGDQGVGNFSERSLNGLLVLHHCTISLGFRQLHCRREPACCKDGLAQLGNEAPGAVRSAEKAGQLGALAADKPAQTQLREVSGLGDSDVGVGGNQVLLGGADIGPP